MMRASSANFASISQGGSILSSVAKRATADQSLTSQATLQNATGMSFTIAANEEWIVQINCDFGAVLSTTGLQVGATLPAGATADFDINLSDIAVTAANVLSGTTTTPATGIALAAATLVGITNAGAIIDLWVLNSSTAGTVQFQFAQNTSSGTALTLRKGSWLLGWRVA